MKKAYMEGHPGLIHLDDKRLNLVFFEVLIFGGSYDDPLDKEGLADLTALNLLRGTSLRSHSEIMDGFNDLGASIDVSSHREYISISGDFMPRYREELADLLSEILSRPAFPADEFRREKALALEDIRNQVNDDVELASYHFHRFVYGNCLDGKPSQGFRRTVSKLTESDCREFYRTHFVSRNVLVVLAGSINADQAVRFAEQVTGGLSEGTAVMPPEVLVPGCGGRRCLLVDKPGRNQAQIAMGHSSASWKSPGLFGLLVGNTAFGGTFTSRLVDEIREKRGWSYGVSSSILAGRDNGTLLMRFFTENKDTLPAIELASKMFEDCARDGLTGQEVESAVRYLVNQYPFRVETVKKRADEQVVDLVFDRQPQMMMDFVDHVSRQTVDTVNQALAKYFRPQCLSVVVVGTADLLADNLVALFGASSVDVIDFRHE